MSTGSSLREAARLIREAAMAAADPGAAVALSLRVEGGTLHAAGRAFTLRGRLLVAAAGKASAGMAESAAAVLGARAHSLLVVVPRDYPSPRLPADARVMAATHPVPDASSAAAGATLLAAARSMEEPDVLLLLLSGGGSSLLSLPRPPLSLADLAEVNHLLLASGADIREMNTVRRHLGEITGGRLAAACRGTIVTLAISDVVGDDLAAIASGPTSPDPTTFADAWAVLERYRLVGSLPAAAAALLHDGRAGRAEETPKSLAPRHHAAVIASGAVALAAASAEARRLGFTPRILTAQLTGEAREAGRMLAREGLETRRAGRGLPACLLAAGETTVKVTGNGRGGRNQEIALAAALELEGSQGVLLCSFASDGREGNTDAAGAHADGGTVAAGRRAGLDPAACLAANDAHSFLGPAGELIVTGPTGTNVNDLSFVLAASPWT